MDFQRSNSTLYCNLPKAKPQILPSSGFQVNPAKTNQVKSALPILFFPSQFPLTSRYCNSNISTSKVNPFMDMDQKDQSTCPLSISSMFGALCKHNDIAAVSTALGNDPYTPNRVFINNSRIFCLFQTLHRPQRFKLNRSQSIRRLET